jgi:adenylate cyclase
MTELAHIFVVDDDPSIRRMLQLLLNDSGYRVSTASSGEEALAYLDLITPDLVLMDLMLPGINGQEVTARIKADTTKPFIPVILITGQSDQRSKVLGLDAGADDFLSKPVEFTELLARVRGMLRLARSQRSLRAEQRKTELLLHLTRELGATLDLDQLLTHFLDRLADAIGAVRASIILTFDDRPRLYSSTRNNATLALEDILRDGIAGWVLRERQPTILADTRDDNRWVASTTHQRMVRSVAAVPIIREDQGLGVITLVHHTPGYFTEEHLDLLGSVAAQSAIALENAELFRLTQSQKDLLERRAEELQRINQVSRHLTELMRPEQLLRLVAHLVHHTFGFPLVSILLRDDDDLVVRAIAGTMDAESRLGLRISNGHGITGWVAANQEPLNVPEVRQDPRFVPFGTNDQTRSELTVPILTAREVFGALDVQSDQPAAFGANDITLLGTLAGQIGVALENAQLFDSEQRRVRQLGQVNNLSVALTAHLDSAEDLRIAADAIATIFGIDQCGIVVADGDGRAARIACRAPVPVTSGAPLRFTLPIQQIAAQLELRAPAIVPNVEADTRLRPLLPLLEHAAIESLALAPLTSSGKQIGMIVIDITGHASRFDLAELTLLETIASLIAQVIDNARLYRRAEDERSTLNAVLGGAADPILLIGPRDQLLLANRAAEQHLGISAEPGRPIDALIAQRDLLQALGVGNGYGPGAPYGGAPPHEVMLPAGETFSISVAPVHGADNQLIGRVAVLQDITAIKELEQREQERLRGVLRRYVSPPVVEQMLAGGGPFGTPVERDVVVLFADLRGYTALTEGIEASVLVEQVLNRYFTAMTDVLYRYAGTIDKFLGDGILGVFGTPIAHADDVQRSLAAAVDLQRAFAELRRDWRAELGLDIGMGIGMGFGGAVIGNIGSTQRQDYTLIGDVVNTASRLGSLARPGQVLVSHRLVDALPRGWRAPWPLREIDRVMLKGKQEPHLIYEIEYEAVLEAR